MLARVRSLTVLATFSLIACSSGPPTDAAGWVKQLGKARTEDEKIAAVKEIRRLGDASVADALVPYLKESAKVRREVAHTLGDMKAKSAVQPLIDAIDFGGTDTVAADANGKVAEALGKIGDKSALPALEKLLKVHNDAVKLSAVRAMGDIRDPAALPALQEIAVGDKAVPFVSKNAIIALGRIGHPDSVPALAKMLVKERKGVSFVIEAGAALFSIGQPALGAVTDMLAGQNKEVMDWARDNNIWEEAVYAKAAQLLGDFAEPSTADALMKRLKYESEWEDRKLIVRTFVADALGRMRHKPAAAALAGMMTEDEANVRTAYARALTMIGDTSVLPAVVASTKKGWAEARSASILAASNLGGADTAEALKKLPAAEKDDGEKQILQKAVDDAVVRLAAAAECKAAFDCWAGKLKDQNPKVRERAAYELARFNDGKSVAPLLAATQDENLDARYAIYFALNWYAHGDHKGEVAKSLTSLKAQQEKEKGNSYYAKVNVDLDRLITLLERNGARS